MLYFCVILDRERKGSVVPAAVFTRLFAHGTSVERNYRL